MPSGDETTNLALFCDFENIALGVRDARYAQFDISRVIERLLLKGSIIVKKAYCDWERYKEFKAGMHHAGFELIEIPHVKPPGPGHAFAKAMRYLDTLTHFERLRIVRYNTQNFDLDRMRTLLRRQVCDATAARRLLGRIESRALQQAASPLPQKGAPDAGSVHAGHPPRR